MNADGYALMWQKITCSASPVQSLQPGLNRAPINNCFAADSTLYLHFKKSKPNFRNVIFLSCFLLVPAPFSCTAENLNIKLKGKTGTLASYNYPLPYDDSVECIWYINVDIDYKIKLSFDFFNLSKTSDCSEDYVEVRDELFSTSDVIGKYCGAEKPSTITSDAWHLRVAFKSSGKTKYPGFKASYETKKAGK